MSIHLRSCQYDHPFQQLYKPPSCQPPFSQLKLALALGVMGVSACTTIPPTEPATSMVLAQPLIPIDAPYGVYDNSTLSTHTQPSIATSRWQQFYADERLKALIALALQNNKDLQQAMLNVKLAKAQYQISELEDIPTLNFNANHNRGANHAVDKNPSDRFSVGLSASNYELDFWGRIHNLQEQALQRYFASSAGQDNAQIILISNVAQTYVNLSYALAQLQLAEATASTRAESLRITQARFNAGVDAKSPSLQADAALESAKLAIYQAQNQILKIRNALQLLVGMPIANELLPPAGVQDVVSPQIFNTGLPSELLHYRPDILQAEFTLKAAGANIAAARAAFFPRITLSTNVGVASPKLGDLFDSSSVSWGFSPSISLPIFDAGALNANYQVSKIQQQQALASYEKTIQTAFKEVNDVLADRAVLDKQLKSQYRLQDNFNETYDIANARYKAGLDNYLTVLDAQRSQFANQQSLLQLEQAKVISQIQLYQALGGGSNIDVPVNLTSPADANLFTFIDPQGRDATLAEAASTARVASHDDVARLIVKEPAERKQVEQEQMQIVNEVTP
ncbi:efflux transporter outer membrane subunit [Moraxella lincolnii]|uniref:efflux transporter outer membrane subunit n=1 Tax=Lwoffella lincolnii TaxID=90241 RepID=UPI003984037C